jgi:SH3-like domain-containing protein
MRHFAVLTATCFVMAPLQALATPVYLRIDSRFPSGQHQRKFLENKTKTVQFQRWLRVKTSDGRFGWLPEDAAVTALTLATEATTTEEVPVRTESVMDAINQMSLKKGTRVLILERSGSWIRTQPLPAAEHPISWIPTDSLKPETDSQTRRVFAFRAAPLLPLPLTAATEKSVRPLSEVKEGSVLTVMSEKGEWLEVSQGRLSGFLRRKDVWTQSDLGEKGGAPQASKTAIRSAPLPYADLITTLAPSMKLTVIETKLLRWGQVQLPDIGSAWWPIAEDFDDERDSTEPKVRLGTAELFARKIFDMASSPAIPQLKFVSAQGVFRTTDGKEWVKIPQFKSENYPIVFASEGPVFVGPFVSDDHGETFQTWIRWDNLVATIKSTYRVTPRGLQILDIRPKDPEGRNLTVRLNIGLEKPIRLETSDQGMTWRAQ